MTLRFLCGALAVTWLTGCGPQTLEVTMNAQNNSAQDGKAVLTDDGTTLTVTLELAQGSDTGAQPAHIHTGNCATLGGIYKGLTSVEGGRSVTELADVRLADLKAGAYAINVHNSQNALTYVACGQIKE
jgi:hypothetical protein